MWPQRSSNVPNILNYAPVFRGEVQGRILTQTDVSGHRTEYTYDAVYQLISEVVIESGGSSTHSTTYTYDSSGNRLSKVDSITGTTTYQYDSAGQLITSVNNGTTTTYSYDQRGNLIVQDSPSARLSYTWDGEGRLISTTKASGATSLTETYAYDAAGNRVSVTDASGQTRRFVVDESGNLPGVVAEYSPDGALIAGYTNGLGPISETRGNSTTTTITDIRGSVKAALDSSGNQLSHYRYDAFGNVVSHTGNLGQLRFIGEPASELNGMLYLRARTYDPSTGRFISRDPVTNVPGVVRSLNPYIYAINDPVNRSDPSGQLLAEFTAAGQAVIQGLIRFGSQAYAAVTTVKAGLKARDIVRALKSAFILSEATWDFLITLYASESILSAQNSIKKAAQSDNAPITISTGFLKQPEQPDTFIPVEQYVRKFKSSGNIVPNLSGTFLLNPDYNLSSKSVNQQTLFYQKHTATELEFEFSFSPLALVKVGGAVQLQAELVSFPSVGPVLFSLAVKGGVGLEVGAVDITKKYAGVAVVASLKFGLEATVYPGFSIELDIVPGLVPAAKAELFKSDAQ